MSSVPRRVVKAKSGSASLTSSMDSTSSSPSTAKGGAPAQQDRIQSAPHASSSQSLASTRLSGGGPVSSTPTGRTSSAGMVSRVLIDVVASRHADNHLRRGANNDPQEGVRISRESAATTALTSTSTLTQRSICRLERDLGKSLPLDAGGRHVTLSSSDLNRVRDAETLKFLEENSEMFVKYFKDTEGGQDKEEEQQDAALGVEPNTAVSSSQDAKRFKPIEADQIAHQVKALCEEIETFITAVDYEGRNYHLHVDEKGELHIPVDVMLDEQGKEDGVLADLTDFNADEISAFNKQFGLEEEEDEAERDGHWDPEEEDEEGGDGDEDGEEERDHNEPVEGAIKNPFDDQVEVDRDSQCSDVRLGSSSMSSQMAPEEMLRQRFDDHRKLLALSGEHGLQKRLERVVAHHKGHRPRYMEQTAASKKTGIDAPHQALPPSPPPAPKPQKSAFQVQYCGKHGGKGTSTTTGTAPIRALEPPRIPVMTQRVTYTPSEEARVNFLLEHDDWDTATQCTSSSASSSIGDDCASVASTAKTKSMLHYQEDSAPSYAPALGGFRPDNVTESRLKSIDEQLAMLQAVRSEAGDTLGSNNNSNQASVARSQASTLQSKTSASLVSAAAMTSGAEAERQAAERRKKIGDSYLEEYRRDKATREDMSRINKRLEEISQQMDVMCTPPFSFNMQYEMSEEPSSWSWPDTLPKPSDDTIRALLEVAQREQQSAQRTRNLHLLPGSTSSEIESSKILMNEFVPPPTVAAPSTTDGNSNDHSKSRNAETIHEDEEPAPSSYYHEQLRERLKRALALADEVDHAEYHGPALEGNNAVPEVEEEGDIEEDLPPLPPSGDHPDDERQSL